MHDGELPARLHRAAIRVLRRVRPADAESTLTAARLSALSVLVFGGPRTMGALAAAEQVRPPTMTRLVQGMVRDGLVEVAVDPDDRRSRIVCATAAARTALQEARRRRVELLAEALDGVSEDDRALLQRAVEILERL